MRYLVIGAICVVMTACGDSEQASDVPNAAPRDTLVPEKLDWEKPTEVFKGDVRGNEIIFAHSKYQAYRLTNKAGVSYGKMNTERGYGDDPDATVYVLNSDKPENEQKYFARMSSGAVYLLDNDRAVVDDAYFTAAASAMSQVTPREKPAVRSKTATRKKSIINKRKRKAKASAKKRRQSKIHRNRSASKSQSATSSN